eukprot:scaffold75484_cov44-Cyclotella_meneghiniana.AAC.7
MRSRLHYAPTIGLLSRFSSVLSVQISLIAIQELASISSYSSAWPSTKVCSHPDPTAAYILFLKLTYGHLCSWTSTPPSKAKSFATHVDETSSSRPLESSQMFKFTQALLLVIDARTNESNVVASPTN